MSTYKQAGVNIALGDQSSQAAYVAAKATFSARKDLIGAPLIQDGGFAGVLDMGNYYLVMGDDGVGTKMDVAVLANKFETLGEDLLAMVVDDAVCIGTEVISMTNTIDVNKVNPTQIEAMMEGLKNACIKQKVVIAGGEIAELGKSVKEMVWNATAVGIVEKEKMITGKKIKVGDKIIALKSNLFRSNGFTLVRYILKNQFGENWHLTEFKDGKTWGEKVLTPSKIYHNAVLELIGRFEQTRKIDVHGIAHITGGGIAGNVSRILKINQLGAELTDLWEPQEAMLQLQKWGNVEDPEAYKTWNMGNGMLLIISSDEVEKSLKILSQHAVEAKVCGEVIAKPKIKIKNLGAFQKEQILVHDL